MPDPTLPPSVYQGLGWSPAADPSQAPPVPMPGDQFGGLPPSIPHALGWAPPDAPPMAPDLPPTPTGLPSMQGQPVQGGPSGVPDFKVPASAFGKSAAPVPTAAPAPRSTPVPAQPQRPQTYDQQMAELKQREAGTEAAQQNAIQAGVDAQKGMHADQLSAYQQADQTVKANADARKAENDAYQKAFATNQAKVDADRQQIDSWKFNRNKYMDDLGVGGKVRWGIGMILAGIGQGMMRQGGPNPVLEMLQQNIHDANAEQFKQRDGLVEKLGFDRQTGQDAAQYHATRQAELDKADGLAYTALGKQLEEAALKSADPIAQANGLKEAANVRAMGDERLKSFIQMKTEHDQKQIENKQRQQQIGIEAGQLGLAQKRFDWEKDKDQQQLDINAAKLLAQKQGKLDEEQAKRAIYIPDANGDLVVARKQDGTPVLAGSAELANKDQNMVAAAATYNKLVGQMIRGIKDHGGESSWIKGGEWQKMMSDLQSATAELHDAYGITSFREPTVQFFEKMATASVDPTSFVRDASGALAQSNRNLQDKVNNIVKARGYDGPRFGWSDTSTPPVPTQTDEDRTVSNALLNPHRGFDKSPGKLNTEVGSLSARGPLKPDETLDSRLKQEGEILPSVRQAMVTWGAALNSPDMAVRNHYYQQLQNIAENSESPETAAFAQQLIDRARDQQITATPGEANAPEQVRGGGGAPRSR